MNKYNSIIKYKKTLETNFFLRLTENIKVRKDLFILINKIKCKGFDQIHNKYIDFDPYPGYSKYLNIKPWFLDNLWRCYILGLNKSKPLNILDIGTGNGYFPYICKNFNHNVRTIDVGSNPLFNELISLLEIPRRDYAVTAFEKISKFDIKFDLITGFHTYFNGHRTENVWTKSEWEFFLKDTRDNLCNKNAQGYFIINKEHNRDKAIDDDLEKYFLSKGAEIDGDRVYFKNLDLV